jgi:hypothetical protein
LPFGVLEALAVFLEESMRSALAANADHQRLLIVDAAQQPLGAFGEEAVGGALEEQERRPRLQLRIALQQIAVSLFQLAEMLALFHREILEDLAAANITRDLGRARVELETAPLRRDRNPQCVAREHEIGVPSIVVLAARPVRHDSQVP